MRLGRRGPKQHSRFAKPPVALGVIGTILILIGVFFAFTKRVPFKEGYRVQAVFQSSVGLRSGSPVRVAGVEVGKVVGFERGPDNTQLVELQIRDNGRPLHQDATLRIRPRLFLEGGYYIEMSPGSPSAPEIDDDGTIPLPQTAIPVQFDEILGVMASPVRNSLRATIEELDRALDDGGAEAAARAARPVADALRDTAIVAEASRGEEAQDVSRLVRGAARATRALAVDEGRLASLVSGLADTTTALAAESAGLRGTVRELDGTLRELPATLRAVDGVLPTVDAALAEARPGLRRARAVLPGAERLLDQLERASAPGELRGLLGDLRPALGELPTAVDRLAALFPLVTPVTDCVLQRALPVLEAKVDDGHLSTGRPVWQNLADSAVGLAGASGNFDANGSAIRYLFTAGEESVTTGVVPGLGRLTGPASGGQVGVRPVWLGPGRQSPFRPDAKCTDQKPPDLSARTDTTVMRRGGASKGATRKLSRAGLRKLLSRKNLENLLGHLGPDGKGRR